MIPDEYAERALLGALLRDPRQILEVQHLADLHAVDFGPTEYQALYQAMIEAAEKNDLTNVDGWNAFHTAILQYATQSGHDRQWLERLAASTQAPDMALRYALMVMENHNRRAIVDHARRIAAEFAVATTQRLDQTQQQIDQMRTTLTKMAQRWQQLGPELGPADRGQPVAAPATASSSEDRPRQSADRSAAEASRVRSRLSDMLPAWTRHLLPQSEEQKLQNERQEREQQLLASLVRDPQQLADIEWLRPEDFSTEHGAALYEAFLTLATRDEPIDAIAVLYEAHRHQPVDGLIADFFITACAQDDAPPAVTLARDVIEPTIVAAVNMHVERLIDEVARGSADTAVDTAVNTLKQIEATVSRYTASREITAGDTYIYTPPDPGLTPAGPQQSTARASAAP
ncbi:DnaB-like helicase N-terminal domain-containing protein [Nonomuraea jabiensis]|uniref:DnaB-like helicase N-terminal domain-containing protein n=1 Tax=Nonomuraea jabiensis TaxID=882448 RepID=UPI003D7030CB